MAALLNSLSFAFANSFLPKYRVKYYDTKSPGILAKCGAMHGSLVKGRYLSFIDNRSQDVNMPFVTSNVMKTPCVKNLLPENLLTKTLWNFGKR